LTSPVKTERTILGHPPGLFVLFFTEMWERMSYYGMRALLVLYMVDHLFIRPDVNDAVLGFSTIRGILESIFGPLAVQPLSSQIYGLATAFVYLTPFFGGMLADRVVGQRKAVVYGAILMAAGNFVLAAESLFFPALLLLILGNGMFKPNIATQVGSLYKKGDPRRDRAFTIFYMGVNLGAFISPLICGTLGQTVGWKYGFMAAGVGMTLGLIIYLFGQRTLAPDTLTMAKQDKGPKKPLSSDEWKCVGALIALCALNVVFWAVYEQQGNTLQLFADRHTNWNIFGWEVPSTWFQSFNPLMIFAFAPLLNVLWAWQARRKIEPSSVVKMAIGCFLLGLAFIILILAVQGLGPDERKHVLWLLCTSFVLTIGELFLSPIGLSLVTKVAPVRIVSMMMGVWFLSSFFGNYLSGYLGTYYDKMPQAAFFTMLMVLAIGAGIAIYAISRPVNRILSKRMTEGESL
jgi:POT family proton-dependent oligopeptide transporter